MLYNIEIYVYNIWCDLFVTRHVCILHRCLTFKKKSLHIGVYTNIILYCILKKKIIIIIIIINIKIVCTHSTKLHIDYTLHTIVINNITDYNAL